MRLLLLEQKKWNATRVPLQSIITRRAVRNGSRRTRADPGVRPTLVVANSAAVQESEGERYDAPDQGEGSADGDSNDAEGQEQEPDDRVQDQRRDGDRPA